MLTSQGSQKLRAANKATANRAMHATAMTTDIDSSKKARRMLGLGLDSWNNILLFFLAITAVAAAFVGFSTYATIQLAKQEAADSKREFEEYKLTVDGKVADAKSEGIKAGEAAGNALVRAAELEKKAAELKTANLALEEKMQPRRLTGENSAKLSAALSKMQPLPIGIVSRIFDPEGADFADDISNAFARAHWLQVRQRDWTMSNKGVAIATLEGTEIPAELSAALLGALDAANIRATVVTIQQSEQNTTSAHFQPRGLYLLVGAKTQ
jgi:hypothetical protein